MKTRANGHVWMMAEQFFNAAEHIIKTENIDLNRYVYALIVNYAFSCELSLKAAECKVKFSEKTPSGILLPVNTESVIRGHNLYDLFMDLKPETRNLIEEAFFHSNNKELTPLLIECSDYFEKARYSFEQCSGTFSLTGVRILAKGLLDSVMAYGKHQK